MLTLQRWHSTWENGIPSGTRLTNDLNEKRKGDSIQIGNFLPLSLDTPRLWVDSEIWIWEMRFCFSSFQIVWQWLCRYPRAPLWTLATSRKREWRRSGDRFSVNCGWPVRLKQQVQVRYRFRSWPFTTAPRSSLRSWEENAIRVVDRITRRLTTMPKRFTSSTWSMVRRKTVSVLFLIILVWGFLRLIQKPQKILWCWSVSNSALPARRTANIGCPNVTQKPCKPNCANLCTLLHSGLSNKKRMPFEVSLLKTGV